jgi:membrane fusion protein, heavy metal efflux system
VVGEGDGFAFVPPVEPLGFLSTAPPLPPACSSPAAGCWRATIDNSARLLHPEMFASAKIMTGESDTEIAVPRDAIIFEGDAARVWVVRDDKGIELRPIKVGLTNGNLVEVLGGLAPSDRVVTRGSLFIDRVAAAGG